MTNPRDSLPEPLRAQIEAAAFEFAAQIVNAFEQSIVDVSERLASQSLSAQPASASAPAKAKAANQPTASSALDRRIERTLARSEDGMSAEQINRVLGSTTPELTPALQRLMDNGRVGKKGKARGTKYFVV